MQAFLEEKLDRKFTDNVYLIILKRATSEQIFTYLRGLSLVYSDEKEERCGKLQKVVESLHLESNKLSQNLISITHFSRISCVCVYIYMHTVCVILFNTWNINGKMNLQTKSN